MNEQTSGGAVGCGAGSLRWWLQAAARIAARVRLVMLKPRAVWRVIADEALGVREFTFKYLLLLTALPWVCWFVGKSVMGERVLFTEAFRWPLWRGLLAAALLYALSLGMIMALAKLAQALASLMHFALGFAPAVQLIGHASIPLSIAGVLFLFPGLEVWWILISLYGVLLLFEGTLRLTAAPPDKRVPFYVVLLLASMIAVGMIGAAAAKFAPPIGLILMDNGLGHV
jgi:hypothetical protein